MKPATMPKAITNVDRDRTIADLISVSRSLMARLDELTVALNQHARIIAALQQQVGVLTLEATLNGDSRHGNEAQAW